MADKLYSNRIFSFLLLWLIVTNQSWAQKEEFKDIVLLNSYHPTFKWTVDITRGVLNEFSNPSEYRVFVEYMDSKRFQNEAYLKQLSRIYLQKYSNTTIDGVIISDNNAFDFFLNYGDKIWGDVPVAFCGNNSILEYKNLDTTRFKGVKEQINIDSTINIIKSLQPELEELIVISDSTNSGEIFSNQFKKAASSHPDLNYSFLIARTPDQLKTDLKRRCSKNKAIYLLSLYIDREGFPREMLQEAPLILNNCYVPIYSNWDFLFGDFITGGLVIRGKDQGEKAAKIMKDLINGRQVPPWLSENREILAFDYKQLNKAGLNYSGLKGEAVLLNKPENPFEKYKQELLGVASVLSFMLITILALLRVINQKKIAEEQLKQSESRLEMALEGANEGLWDLDFTNYDVFLSQRFARLLKYSNPNELNIGFTNYENLFHPSDFPQMMEAYEMHKTGHSPLFHSEARMLTKTGHYIWFSIHGKIIETDENHEPVRMVGTITQIQSQKEFENKLKEAKERAEESDRLKSAFLANMSHEIRTPMNAILGFTDLIMNDMITPEEGKKYLEVIKSSGENLLNIINDIIDISKIESGQLKIKQETFDLHSLLGELQDISENLIFQGRKPIEIIVHKGSENKNFFIKTDPFRLHQILLNLLTNAIKFTKTGHIELGYIILDKGALQFFVKDTGQGIAPKHRNIIFERFRQVDETSIRKFGGTGLGLAITKSLISMMKGNIWLDSEVNKGSKFYFSLPCEFKLKEPDIPASY
ncbi:sensor histidine kinase [Marinilabilia rubra]|uniref:histidine kinase n=1 Tax=Marinilabilia rubra TaxID=2162893 RepID=A0A2U2B3I8_9BACT|nr:PAS domain-containing protein [Marinilabilia rubra]PWD97632.1 PAS domain-containing sensor histidine kinase [Marinilabilia rubra]